MNNNLWDSIADMDAAREQEEQRQKAASGGWGLMGVALTKLRGTTTTTATTTATTNTGGCNHGARYG